MRSILSQRCFQQKMKIPIQLFHTFFKIATSALNDFPSPEVRDKLFHEATTNSSDIDDTTADASCSLDLYRKYLLQIQVEILKQIVDETNRQLCFENKDSIDLLQIEMVQNCLRHFADMEQVMTAVDLDAQDDSVPVISSQWDSVRHSMTLMNQAARVAYVRSILCIENQYEQQEYTDSVDTTLTKTQRQYRGWSCLLDRSSTYDTSDIAEFCTLCRIAMDMDEVQQYLCQATHDLFENTMWSLTSSSSSTSIQKNTSTPHQRIIQIQGMILRAMRYDSEKSLSQLDHWIQNGHSKSSSSSLTLSESDEILINDTLLEYVSCINIAMTNATIRANQAHMDLSDHAQGGVTRIVSVTYSEKDLGSSIENAPKQERMEEHSEKVQRESLDMAKKAVSLQQSIVNEIMSMEESDRDKILQEAKYQHEQFMEHVQALPAGQDRVAFLRNMDPQTQKMLIVYNLWKENTKEDRVQT